MVDLKNIESEILPKVEEVIKKILDSKDEADRKKALESAFEQANVKLEKSSNKIAELTNLVESKDAEVNSLKEVTESLKVEHAKALEEVSTASSEKVKALEAIVEEKSLEIAKISEELNVAKASLADIELNAKAVERIELLKAAGVAYSSEEAAKKQLSKVKGMSDEDFEDYKSELEALVAEVKAVASVTTQEVVVDKGVIPPPEVPAGGANDARLNLETASLNIDRIKELGNVMAKMIRNSGEDTED